MFVFYTFSMLNKRLDIIILEISIQEPWKLYALERITVFNGYFYLLYQRKTYICSYSMESRVRFYLIIHEIRVLTSVLTLNLCQDSELCLPKVLNSDISWILQTHDQLGALGNCCLSNYKSTSPSRNKAKLLPAVGRGLIGISGLIICLVFTN